MDKKLSIWAKENDISYMNAYRKFQRGELKGAYKTAQGSILIEESGKTIDDIYDNPDNVKMVSASETRTRRNKSAVSDGAEPFKNIDDGITPFQTDGSYVSVKDAVELCQKAYYNFDVFRNTIDLMTEFSVTNITFRGGSKKSRELFKALFNRVGLWNLQDMFYREDYRSGNVIIYRYDVEVKKKDVEKLMQVFAQEEDSETKVKNIQELMPNGGSVKFPAKYIILNPVDIKAGGSIDFSSTIYYKTLTSYEIFRLRERQHQEDQDVYDSLPPEIQKQIDDKQTTGIMMPLDPSKIYASFYKKQSYEPFAIPMGYPVLSNINAKAELRKMDVAIARTAQQAILLITLGYESKDGKYHYPQNVASSIQELFANESVCKVLVADFTVKASFVIPEIAEILDPKKYEVIDRDINIGLNNILVGGEKFANQAMKVQVFIERLRHAREQFKNDFLIPEIKRIAKELKLKNYPMPYFEEINLKDALEFAKVYTRLIELGVLTPEEGINAIETGTLPTPEESLESQKKLKEYKDDRLYQPLTGGGVGDQMELAKENAKQKALNKPATPSGRPSGTKSKRTPKPRGASFSLTAVKESINSIAKLTELVKENLKTEDEGIIENLVEVIASNEPPSKWNKKLVNSYIKNPIGTNEEMAESIEEIMHEHQVSRLLASILYHSNA